MELIVDCQVLIKKLLVLHSRLSLSHTQTNKEEIMKTVNDFEFKQRKYLERLRAQLAKR